MLAGRKRYCPFDFPNAEAEAEADSRYRFCAVRTVMVAPRSEVDDLFEISKERGIANSISFGRLRFQDVNLAATACFAFLAVYTLLCFGPFLEVISAARCRQPVCAADSKSPLHGDLRSVERDNVGERWLTALVKLHI